MLIPVDWSLRLGREKFAPHFMVSAGICFDGTGRLNFVDEKAELMLTNLTNLIPKLIEDAAALMPSSFIQQDGARSLPQAPEKAINDRGTSNHIAEDLVRVNDLPRKLVAKAVQNFRKRSQA